MTTIKTCLKYSRISKTDVDKIILVGGSTRIPQVQDLIKNYFDNKPIDIDADQAVAYGAAVHAAILTGNLTVDEFPHHILNDITLMSLGFGAKSYCKYMCFVIPRNTVLPFRNTIKCSTIKDQQEFIYFRIHQGEHILADTNLLVLGRCRCYL